MFIWACADDSAGAPPGADARFAATDALDDGRVGDARPAADGSASLAAEQALLVRLAGLWTGPATRTPLGDFPVMNMDLRAADHRTLFSRFDLDAGNNLRFAFAIEDTATGPTLVYRNGGDFGGLMRDTRTVLVEHDETDWRFCHPDRGCDYLEAHWRLPDADRVELIVDVRGQRHVEWRASRAEARTLPLDFDAATGAFDAPFPPLPTLTAQVTWVDPLPAETPVWLLVSTTACGLAGRCTPARILSTQAPAGATEATLALEQVHPGDYFLNAVLDRNGNFRARRFPDRGDGLSLLDRAYTLAADAADAVELGIVLTVP
ncbi:MAG: hypothetical protein KC620_25955 [Myxococcales bacterium]|nr:hypothetical protein [Myxococcales bacterium]